jgi:uncharacterized protein DUF3631
MLLSDIQDVITGRPRSDRISSNELAAALGTMEDRPWAEWRNGKPMTASALSRMLSPFGILSISRRDGAETFKGYLFADFKDAFDCYLTDETVTQSQRNNDAHCDTLQTVTPENLVTFSKALQSNNHGHCDGVTVSNGDGASSQHKCDHCQQYGGTIEVAYDGAEKWLHRECMEAWRTAYDELDIRSQPFYRLES